MLLLICVLGRFDNEIVRDALKDLAYQFWPGYAVGDGTVGEMLPSSVVCLSARRAKLPYCRQAYP